MIDIQVMSNKLKPPKTNPTKADNCENIKCLPVHFEESVLITGQSNEMSQQYNFFPSALPVGDKCINFHISQCASQTRQ